MYGKNAQKISRVAQKRIFGFKIFNGGVFYESMESIRNVINSAGNTRQTELIHYKNKITCDGL